MARRPLTAEMMSSPRRNTRRAPGAGCRTTRRDLGGSPCLPYRPAAMNEFVSISHAQLRLTLSTSAFRCSASHISRAGSTNKAATRRAAAQASSARCIRGNGPTSVRNSTLGECEKSRPSWRVSCNPAHRRSPRGSRRERRESLMCMPAQTRAARATALRARERGADRAKRSPVRSLAAPLRLPAHSEPDHWRTPAPLVFRVVRQRRSALVLATGDRWPRPQAYRPRFGIEAKRSDGADQPATIVERPAVGILGIGS